MMCFPRNGVHALVAAAMILLAAPAYAAGFSAAASPSRFELQADPGQVVSRALEVQHVGADTTEYVIRSADWTLEEQGGLQFFDELQPGTCRPWLRLERRTVRLAPGERRRLRFEMHVPADAPAGECRLAILIENYQQQAVPVVRDSPINLPLSGRLGVIVYLGVGDVAPRLELVGITTGEQSGRRLPMVRVRNVGTAHGRLDGTLQGTDAQGRDFLFPVSTLPVLPGQERALPLLPSEDRQSGKLPQVEYPVQLRGELQWDDGRFPIDVRVR